MSDIRTKVKDTIWLVSARRGDYSDRTEYAVCWFATEREAKDCAERMEAASNEWRSRLNGMWITERWEQAQAEIGDTGWSPNDHTDYRAYALERGREPK